MLLTDLFESFDKTVPIDWKKSHKKWRGSFVIDGSPYMIYFNRFEGEEWTFAFTAIDERGEETYLPTKKGRGAMTVLSTVFNTAVEFIREMQPDMLSFTGRDDTGQSSVYTRIMRSFLKPRVEALGYEVDEETYSSFVNFIIRKPGYEEIEPLTEALDRPHDFTWTAKRSDLWAMEFHANGQRYRMSAIKGTGTSRSPSKTKTASTISTLRTVSGKVPFV